jgi:hypothetical protein
VRVCACVSPGSPSSIVRPSCSLLLSFGCFSRQDNSSSIATSTTSALQYLSSFNLGSLFVDCRASLYFPRSPVRVRFSLRKLRRRLSLSGRPLLIPPPTTKSATRVSPSLPPVYRFWPRHLGSLRASKSIPYQTFPGVSLCCLLLRLPRAHPRSVLATTITT